MVSNIITKVNSSCIHIIYIWLKWLPLFFAKLGMSADVTLTLLPFFPTQYFEVFAKNKGCFWNDDIQSFAWKIWQMNPVMPQNLRQYWGDNKLGYLESALHQNLRATVKWQATTSQCGRSWNYWIFDNLWGGLLCGVVFAMSALLEFGRATLYLRMIGAERSSSKCGVRFLSTTNWKLLLENFGITSNATCACVLLYPPQCMVVVSSLGLVCVSNLHISWLHFSLSSFVFALHVQWWCWLYGEFFSWNVVFLRG